MCSIKYIKKDMIAGTSSCICALWVNFKHSSVFSGRNQRWWEGVILSSKMTVTKTMTMIAMIIVDENCKDQSSNKGVKTMQKMAMMKTMRTVMILTTMTMFRKMDQVWCAMSLLSHVLRSGENWVERRPQLFSPYHPHFFFQGVPDSLWYTHVLFSVPW